MKKQLIIISLILVIILSSFSFAFADSSSEDYSWILNKPITLNSNLTSFYNPSVNPTVYRFGEIIFNDHSYFDIGIINEYSFYFWEPSTFTLFYDLYTQSFQFPTPIVFTITSFDPEFSSYEPFFTWLFANSNVESFRPVKSVTSELIQPVVNLLSSVRSGISTFFTFVTNAFNDIYSIPAVFPSLWALVPSSVTSVYLGMFVIVTFMGILKFILSK